MDNSDWAGTTIYFPVWAEGALFTCGDGHGVQGDGEVCVTALETALTGTFTFTLHKQPRRAADMPRAETPTHLRRWASTRASTKPTASQCAR